MSMIFDYFNEGLRDGMSFDVAITRAAHGHAAINK